MSPELMWSADDAPAALGRLSRPGHWVLHELPARFLSQFRRSDGARVLVTGLLAAFTTLALLATAAEHLLLEVDTAVQDVAIGARQGWLNTAMVWLTFLGTRWAIVAFALVLALWAGISGRCRTTVIVIVVAVALNPVFEVLFKELVGRARPDEWRLLAGNGPSFPSGHVLASVGFYGMIPLLVWEATSSYVLRRAAFFASSGVILAVAVSRVYIDVHWTTDVVAGLLLGTVLVLATYHALAGHSLHRARTCCTPAPA